MIDFLINILTKSYEIALPALLGYIVWLLKEQRRKADLEDKRREDNSRGTMLLLRVKLIEYHDEYVKRGHISSYAYQNFCEMYEVYHALRWQRHDHENDARDGRAASRKRRRSI